MTAGSRIACESNAETAGSDAVQNATMLHDAGRRANEPGSGRRGQPWYVRTYRDAHARTEADTPGKDSPGDDEYRAMEKLLCTMFKLRGEGGRREEHIV